MPKIAFIGLGSMGKPMASRLLAAGWPVAVFNRSPGKAEGLGGSVRVASSPEEAVRGAEIVITMVADDGALEAVTLGDHGLLPALGRGAIHVSMSTISVAYACRMAAVHEAAGHGYLAAPVFGRPNVAAEGKLWAIVGGRADLLECCRTVLERMAQQIVHVGEQAEKANLVKVAGNFTIAAMLEALGEAIALVRKAGVEPAQFLEIVNGALFKSPIYENYGRLIVEARYEPPGFRFRHGLKDAGLVLAAATAAAVPMPSAGVVHGHLLSGLAQGMGDKDWSAVARVIAANAGLP